MAPIDISEESLEFESSTPNVDFVTLDLIARMQYGKARTASIIDEQTKMDISFKVKRQLSTLAGSIGRTLKYYNHKDYVDQIPDGRVGFAVVSENTSSPSVQAMLTRLNEWRTQQEAKGSAVSPNGTDNSDVPPENQAPKEGEDQTPKIEDTPQGAPNASQESPERRPGRGR